MDNKINLIGIVGKSGHGKDYTSQIIRSFIQQKGQSCEITNFALSIRELLYKLLGIPIERTYSEEDKNKMVYLIDTKDDVNKIPSEPDPQTWIFKLPSITEIINVITEFLTSYNIEISDEKIVEISDQLRNIFIKHTFKTVRFLLQILGSDIMREHVGSDIWVNILIFKWYKQGCPITIVTDCRFLNEYDTITSLGKVIRVVRYKEDGTLYLNPNINTRHVSETSLDHLVDEMETLVNTMDKEYDDKVIDYCSNNLY